MTFARLAELIDPDVTRNVPVSQIAGLLDADLGRMVDREALLELADECDEMRGDGLPIGPHEVYRIARRIREACGEETQ